MRCTEKHDVVGNWLEFVKSFRCQAIPNAHLKTNLQQTKLKLHIHSFSVSLIFHHSCLKMTFITAKIFGFINGDLVQLRVSSKATLQQLEWQELTVKTKFFACCMGRLWLRIMWLIWSSLKLFRFKTNSTWGPIYMRPGCLARTPYLLVCSTFSKPLTTSGLYYVYKQDRCR